MKDKLTIMALFAIVGITSGLVGYTFSTSEEVNQVATSYTTSALAGHLTIEARDGDGNLKAYRQTDNVITNTGENCALRALFSTGSFGTGVGTTVCTGAMTQPFSAIQLGTGTTFEQETNKVLVTPITDSGLSIAVGSVTWTNATGVDLTDAAKVVVSKAFTVTGTKAVTEAGLFNGTTDNTNGMFARKTFAAVNVLNGDTLTVNWTVYVGNATAAGIGTPDN